MTLETLSQPGEFVGGFGVVFSLVYLAVQVRSNTRLVDIPPSHSERFDRQ